MLSYQIREYYEYALSELKKLEKSISILFEYENRYQNVSSNAITEMFDIKKNLETLEEKLKLPDKQGKWGNSVKSAEVNACLVSLRITDSPCISLVNAFNKLNDDLISKFNFYQASGDFSIYKNNIKKYKEDNGIVDFNSDYLVERIDPLFESYQNYIRSQRSREKAVMFMQQFFNFKECFDAVKNTYRDALRMFGTGNNDMELEGQDNCAVMEVQLLKVELSFEEFVLCLSSLQKIYSELCHIVRYKNNTEPLKIVRIESGSLLTKVYGDKNALEATALLLEKTVMLCFTKFTRSGKSQTKSELKKKIQEDLNLGDELSKLGFNLTSTDDKVVKAFQVILDEALRLASAAPKYKINGKMLECHDYNSQNYLDVNRTKFITTREDSSDLEAEISAPEASAPDENNNNNNNNNNKKN